MITIVVDAFRAFATAGYVLEQGPAAYFYTNRCDVVRRLAEEAASPVLIGKAGKGSVLQYAIPNSPTRVLETAIEGQVVIHRTEAGAKGVLAAQSLP